MSIYIILAAVAATLIFSIVKILPEWGEGCGFPFW